MEAIGRLRSLKPNSHWRIASGFGTQKVRLRRSPLALAPWNGSMVKNIVAGCVVVALILMGLLVYAQKHEGCVRGHSIKNFKQPCGSVEHSI
jgi:hypothetical protein